MARAIAFSTCQHFSKVPVGQAQSITYLIRNDSNSEVRLDSYWFSINPSFYQVTGGTCHFDNENGFTLEGQQSCTLDIRFAPKTQGLQSNTFSIGYFLDVSTWQENSCSLRGDGV